MSSSRNSRQQAAPSRMSMHFVPGEGINREVITTDICRYLGNDALVKPGDYTDPTSGRKISGYFVTAYRPLTTEQLNSLKQSSQRWMAERSQNPPMRGQPYPEGGISPRGSDLLVRSNITPDAYSQSATRAREPWAADIAPPSRDRDQGLRGGSMPQGQSQAPGYDPRYEGQHQLPQGQSYGRSPDAYNSPQNYSYGPTVALQPATPRYGSGAAGYGTEPTYSAEGRSIAYPTIGGDPYYGAAPSQNMGRGQQTIPSQTPQYSGREQPPDAFYGRTQQPRQPSYQDDVDYYDEDASQGIQSKNPSGSSGQSRQREKELDRGERRHHKSSRH